MGQGQSSQGFPGQGGPGDKKDQVREMHLPLSSITHDTHDRTIRPSQDKQKKKWEPPAPPPRVGRKQRKRDGASGLGSKIPTVTPNAKCKLRLLKLERVKDWLLMEEEFVANQEQLRPQEERNKEDRSKVGVQGANLDVINHHVTGGRPPWLPHECGHTGGDH